MRRVIVPLIFIVLVSLATVLPPVYASSNDGVNTVEKACALEE